MVRLTALLYLLIISAAHADCRQALAIGLDVSGSVDAQEYRLQLDGLAGALQNTEVRSALLAMPSTPVSMAVYEWSGPEDQHLIVGWTAIRDPETLDRFTARLFATTRTKATPSTAIGSSMLYGVVLLRQQADCWSQTLDLSGDGIANSGPRPRDVKANSLTGRITINALVVGDGDMKTASPQNNPLTDYYESEVIFGPAAFAEQAASFEHFQAVMVRKLLRELQGLTVSQLHPAD